MLNKFELCTNLIHTRIMKTKKKKKQKNKTKTKINPSKQIRYDFVYLERFSIFHSICFFFLIIEFHFVKHKLSYI